MVENWRGRGLPKNTEKGFYGRACPELRPSLESGNLSAKIKLLRNGGMASIQPRKLGFIKVSLNNTCAVDSIIHLLVMPYCDSLQFRQFADDSESKLIKLSIHLVKKGANAEANQLRTELLYEKLPDARKEIKYGLVGLDCSRAPEELLNKLGLPHSAQDQVTCSSIYCPERNTARDIAYIAVGFDELGGKITNLQATLEANQEIEPNPCSKPFEDTGSVPLIPDNVVIDESISKKILCSGIATHKGVAKDLVFLSVAGKHVTSESTQKFTYECQLESKLLEVPRTLIIFNKVFILRGVVAFVPPGFMNNSFKNVGIGHYLAYSRRVSGQWFCLDDLRDSPKSVAENTKVKLDMLFYSAF